MKMKKGARLLLFLLMLLFCVIIIIPFLIMFFTSLKTQAAVSYTHLDVYKRQARDCSKKQRAVKRMKGMSGQRISSNPPYGYIKGEGGQLVPDPDAAWVVKLMFDLAAQGLGPVRIANILTKKKIPTPGTLAFRRTGKKRNYHPEAPYNWSDSTIANILEYKEYLGHTVNFKTYSKSYKFKKRLPCLLYTSRCV